MWSAFRIKHAFLYDMQVTETSKNTNFLTDPYAYCLLLRRMQLTFTVSIGFLTLATVAGAKCADPV